MKRILSLCLILAMVLPLGLSFAGCSVVSSGSDFCIRFLEHIVAGEFGDAYDMLPESTKKEDPNEKKVTPTPTPTPTPTATPEEEETDDPGEMEYAEIVEATLPPEPTPILPIQPVVSENPSEEGTASREMEENGLEAVNGVLQEGRQEEPDAFASGEEPEETTPEPEETPEPEATPEPEEEGKRAKRTPKPTETPEPSPTPALDEDGNPIIEERITRQEFIDKYTSIFDELQLTGIDYEVKDVIDGDILGQINYTLTYHSARGGDLTYDFTMTANRIEYRWTVDWSPNLIFPMMDWGDNVRVGVLQANRGEILCDGVPYAQNVNIITVFAVPSSVEAYAIEEAKKAGVADEDLPTRQEIYEDFAKRVAAIPEIELTEEAVLKAMNRAINDFAKLKTFFPDEITDAMKETFLSVKGLAIDANNYGTQRYYPYGESLCHIVGYAGIITKEKKLYYERIAANEGGKYSEAEIELASKYNGDSWVGNYGLEYVYEETLLGTNGRFTYIQDPQGGSKGMLYKTDAVDGKDLHLTIKPELQERLEDVVDQVVYDSSIHGAVVVLNPQTGAIQAMTSFPGFDLNYLARGMPEEEWAALENHPDIPLYNRATQGLYTPGSVFKTMTSAALIETGTMRPTDVFPASEQAHIDGDEWTPSDGFMNSMPERTDMGSWKEQSNPGGDKPRPLRRTQNTGRHTPMNMMNSLVDSDNLFFAYGAMRMGWTKIETYMNKLGWTEPLELERQYGIPDENNDGADKRLETSTPQLYDKTKKQNDYDLAVTGYGQGQIMVSPLQMAVFVSAYANNGVAMNPYVVDSIWHANGTDYTLVEQKEPKVWKNLIQESTVNALLPALRMVCTEGTAKNLTSSFLSRAPFKLGYTFAGKTGTAEITDDKSKELAWFVCWRDKYTENNQPVSAEDARLICIMLEVDLPMGMEWSQMKYDIARAMMKDYVLNE
ncbi:MAG: hypothetical protein IJF41_04635 [Clostridia bacterium]|nr:hypothetical protein [Clostridia bacterium]